MTEKDGGNCITNGYFAHNLTIFTRSNLFANALNYDNNNKQSKKKATP